MVYASLEVTKTTTISHLRAAETDKKGNMASTLNINTAPDKGFGARHAMSSPTEQSPRI